MNEAFPLPQAQVSHNQIGQRLGRKGQETRERILAAMLSLVADPDGPSITLTNVAAAAKVRLTNLYLYFPDLGDLVLAALERVMESAEEAFVARLRRRWGDDELHDACLDFLEAHYAFWKRNARLLHLRNALADAGDIRVVIYRNAVTRPLIDLLLAQMAESAGDCSDVATVLMTALERVATVVTNQHFQTVIAAADKKDRDLRVRRLLAAESGIIALVIGHQRSQGQAGPG
jgi:AcrR family transcriptional regulator